MISIIICSRTTELNEKLLVNITNTIGVTHEIVLVDNSTNCYNICQAYNMGIEKSRFDILCFMHDDILFNNDGWGVNVIEHFKNDSLKAIGVAGTPYCPFMPGPWWGSGIIYEYMLQGSATSVPVLKSSLNNVSNNQVVLVDGVWFCTTKNVFKQIKFDEATFSGFHFYDIDICMQLHTLGYPIHCVNNVLISHKSMGQVNANWIDSALLFHEKWKTKLPASCNNKEENILFAAEYKTLNAFIWICSLNSYSNQKIYRLALKYLLKFKSGYRYYKTPGYFAKFLYKFLFKKGQPFYN